MPSSSRLRRCAVVFALWFPAALVAAPGDLDCSFASNGVLAIDLAAGVDAAHDVALAADGALLFVADGLRVVRVLPSGAVDTQFGVAGIATFAIPDANGAFDIAIDGQGRILVAGARNAGDSEVWVASLSTSGAVDPSFGGGDGWTGFDWSADTANAGIDRVGDLLVASGDRPILVGSYDANGNTFNPSNANVAIARLTVAGELDPAFATGGIGTASSPGNVDDDARDAAIDSRGRIVTTGDSFAASGVRNTIVTRWTDGGRIDPGFGAGGVAVVDAAGNGGGDFGIAVAIDADDRPVLLSGGSDDPIVARLTTAGSLDPGFGTGGLVQRSFLGGQDVPERILVQSDGRILVTGWPFVTNAFRFASMRFLASGALDTSWGGSGVVTTAFGGNMRAYAAILTAGDRLVMAGGFDNDTRLGVVRYAGAGSPTSTIGFSSQSPNPSLRTEPVQFTVAVASAAGTPTGAVQIGDGVDSCSAPLSATGPGTASGTCAVAFRVAGARTVTANYAGGGGACASTASTQQQVRYRVTASAGAGGGISPPGVQGVAPGGTLAFTVQPAPGNTIRQVSGCGGTRSGNTFTTGPVNDDCSVVASFNQAPVAQPGSLVVLEDAVAGNGQLLATDDGDPLSFAVATPPARGNLTITNPATGAYSYTPGADANGSDGFTFRVDDGTGVSAPANVAITITAVNDAPALSVGADLAHPAGTTGPRQRAGFLAFDAGPPDEDASQALQDYVFGPVADPAGVLVPGSLAGSAGGTLSYALTGRGGSVEIDVRARDDGGTDNGGVDLSQPRRFRITVAPGADLQVAIDDGRGQVVPGQGTIYAVVVANAGPDDVAAATLGATLPPTLTDVQWACVPALSTAPCPDPQAGTGTFSTPVVLPVGTALRFDLAGNVDAPVGSSLVVGVQSALQGGVDELDPANDSASDTNSVVSSALFGDGFEGAVLTVPAARRALGAGEDPRGP